MQEKGMVCNISDYITLMTLYPTQWEPAHEGNSCESFAKWLIDNDPNAQELGLAAHLQANGIGMANPLVLYTCYLFCLRMPWMSFQVRLGQRRVHAFQVYQVPLRILQWLWSVIQARTSKYSVCVVCVSCLLIVSLSGVWQIGVL